MKLTWDDLLIQEIQAADAQQWIEPWSHMLPESFAPVVMSKFGDWFLRRPDGSTDELSVIEGTLRRVASTPEEFIANVNCTEWQEVHLHSSHVAQLHRRGMVPSAGQCYGFAPHPIFTGRIEIKEARIMSIRVWQSIAAQSFVHTRAF